MAKKRVADVLVDTLVAAGVERVLGCCGFGGTVSRCSRGKHPVAPERIRGKVDVTNVWRDFNDR
jgi:hypothetical protein